MSATKSGVTRLELDDIQGNTLRGYRLPNGRHFLLSIVDPRGASRFIGGLISGDQHHSPQVTTAAEWNKRPRYCLNTGLTWSGLKVLGLPEAILNAFPQAFVQGPAAPARAKNHGDTGPAAPEKWVFGGPKNEEVHIIVSLYTDERQGATMQRRTKQLRKLFAAGGLREIYTKDAAALPAARVHFGYRDGIAQPTIKGEPGRDRPDMQPECEPGEFLLGKDYVNQYGGNFIGDLPAALADNAAYGAVRMLEQDVRGFEDFLVRAGERWKMQPEEVAAKMMGRWRNGVPLVLSPNTDGPAEPIPESDLNKFDYAATPAHPTYLDDRKGLRCPVGAHIRRLNPRGALVMGKSHSRRIIRRGMPYGPAFDPKQPNDGIERGLFGYFICG
ncbi:MAG: peroxidase, partial [Gemmatimonadetes bacterium]|nr:peroxidase [Gemmatimonadota bacterium]